MKASAALREQLEKCFRIYDMNCDGVVTLDVRETVQVAECDALRVQEMMNIDRLIRASLGLKHNEGDVTAEFHEQDADGNDEVSLDEFVEYTIRKLEQEDMTESEVHEFVTEFLAQMRQAIGF